MPTYPTTPVQPPTPSLNDNDLLDLFDSLGLYTPVHPTATAPTPATPTFALPHVANPHLPISSSSPAKKVYPRKKTPPEATLPDPILWTLPPPVSTASSLLLLDALSLIEMSLLYHQRLKLAPFDPAAILLIANQLLAHLLTSSLDWRASHWALLFESDPTLSWRLTIDPLYRRSSPLQRQRTFSLCTQWRTSLQESLQSHCIVRETLEARDVAHSLIKQWKKNHPSQLITLASHRLEFLLLLDDHIQLVHPLSLLSNPQQPAPATTYQLHKTLHVNSTPQFIDLISLIGCPHLNVPGIPSFGILKSAALLAEVKTLQHLNQTVYRYRNHTVIPPTVQKLRTHITSLLHYEQLLLTKTDQPLHLTWKQLQPASIPEQLQGFIPPATIPLQPYPIAPALSVYKIPLDYS